MNVNRKNKSNTSSKVKQNENKKKIVSSNWQSYCTSVGRCPAIPNQDYKKKEKHCVPTKSKPSKVVAIDCEMVAEENGQDMLARVSIVDFGLKCIYDKYVKPTRTVVDYRTKFSGIRPENLVNGEEFKVVQEEVRNILKNKFLVGHGLRNDFHALGFGHHAKLIRDTSLYKPFRDISNGMTPRLKKLAHHFLEEDIQDREHDSIEDAAAAMKLYKKFRQPWEKSIMTKLKV